MSGGVGADAHGDAVREVDGGPAADAGGDRRIRIARRALVASMTLLDLMFVGFPLLDVTSVAARGGLVWPSVAAVPLGIGCGVLLHLLFTGRMAGRRDPAPWPYWGSLALLVLCCAGLQDPFNGMTLVAAWWCVGAFSASRRRTVWVSALLLALPWLLVPTTQADVRLVPFLGVWLFAVVYALVLGAGMLTCLWLWEIVNDAVAGQRARARLAVTEERLRFSRDMHDLLGHSLSALAVKSELAARLAERDPERAAVEIAEVRSLARTSLAQVRSAVSGYREVDLAEEVGAVGAVLRANRTEVAVTGLDGLEASPGAAALAAWVVREGATNVLRHSDATRCEISFTRTRDPGAGAESLAVEVANNRARSGGDREATSSGNGLSGLSERVAAGGGVLSASRTEDGGFLLRAVLPL
ncbi:sensor histidine kinase [Nocardiopsis sp. FIRDI 009]|uniref:sensor histidine kinase n=1 Tax=Nocardiopsis sp. FIRDI 009 TaxID=714197 RepID=UPI001E632C12|nr:sensor histidine kinase [Nocardiopsis sp. FIRDI 009]